MTEKSFDDLLNTRFGSEQRQRINNAARKKVRAIRLGELREKLGQKQEDLAEKLGVSQSGVSRIERRDNLGIQTLRRYLKAMGARLEIRAVFDDSVEILISTETDTRACGTQPSGT